MKRLFSKFASKVIRDTYGQVTYSQCGEDIIIDLLFQQLGNQKPTYIDIGAHHPQHINNTYLFYLRGCRGINVEPDPVLFSRFNELRPEDINLNIGISDVAGVADFYMMSESTLNTFSKEDADRAKEENSASEIREVRRITVDTLQHVLQAHNNGKFPDLFTIDVEGLDERILRSVDLDTNGPAVLCVETLTYSSKKKGVKKNELIDHVRSKGYHVYADTYINTIFVKTDLWEK